MQLKPKFGSIQNWISFQIEFGLYSNLRACLFSLVARLAFHTFDPFIWYSFMLIFVTKQPNTHTESAALHLFNVVRLQFRLSCLLKPFRIGTIKIHSKTKKITLFVRGLLWTSGGTVYMVHNRDWIEFPTRMAFHFQMKWKLKTKTNVKFNDLRHYSHIKLKSEKDGKTEDLHTSNEIYLAIPHRCTWLNFVDFCAEETIISKFKGK